MLNQTESGLRRMEGDNLRNSGITATLAAERQIWRERAIELLARYAQLANRPFTMEEFRGAWTDLGYEEPHNVNVWGAVTRIAYEHNLIRPTGKWVKSKHPKAHSRLDRKSTRLNS